MYNEPRQWEIRKLKDIQKFFEEEMMCTMRFDICENIIKIQLTRHGGRSILKSYDRQSVLFDSFEQQVKTYLVNWLEGAKNEKKKH